MSVTKKIIELDSEFQLYNEAEWNSEYEHRPGSFTSFNDAGLETEVGEFLFAMTRLLKPDRVLETGTHWGVGASYIGMGLKENGKGHLDTIEFQPPVHEKALNRITRLGLSEQVTCHLGYVENFSPTETYKLILLDTEPQTRFAELIRFFPHLEPGGFVYIHDLHRHMGQTPNEEHGYAWPYGPLPAAIQDLVATGQLRPFHFDSPRGFTGFYKVHHNDYRWPLQSGAHVDASANVGPDQRRQSRSLPQLLKRLLQR